MKATSINSVSDFSLEKKTTKGRAVNTAQFQVGRTDYKSTLEVSCILAERKATKLAVPPPENSTSRRQIGTETRKTAFNALYVSLRTLSAVSSRIPMGTPLSAVIDPLLDLTDRLEQTSINTYNIDQIAGRIERLTPLVEKLTKNNSAQGQIFIDSLKRELDSISMELQAAQAEGKLAQFFNADYNMVIIEKHNMALAQLIADSTLVTVHEVLISLRALERSKSEDPSLSELRCGYGGSGGSGFYIGGEGGLGEGPKLDMDLDERHQIPFGNISGGTGGQGGNSRNVGGRGGTGEGPVISVRRTRSRFLTAVELGAPAKELMS
ncbi:hypothetical protein R3P38DRAFT_2844979 [Favolaschia claudopus]|uniref:Uncharacterized protein n=1 Tax=Favolaschia claudopus TaxID=2862362 RepID=A0AAW0DUG9_9AGAR